MKCLNKGCVVEAASDSNYCFEHRFSSGTISKLVDGSLSLAGLQNMLTAMESAEALELFNMERQSDNNLAFFRDISPRHPLSPLYLVEVKSGHSSQAIIAEQLSKGKTLVFSSSIFVDGKDTSVAAFR
jgi:hypothetical protein